MNDVIVICTRNRRDDLAVCLGSILNLETKPAAVLVVDSSDSDDSSALVQNYMQQSSDITYFLERTAPGLTLQRNHGLRVIDGRFDVVHFLDDDVELESGYIGALQNMFEGDPDLVGAGGMVLGSVRQPASTWSRLCLTDSALPGSVNRAGFNVGCYDNPNTLEVTWLPGCSMSFRLKSISGLAFDEGRTGYALGEDVDFGLKASSRGRLLHVPSAVLQHHQSPTNRHKRPILVAMGVRNRWQLAVDELGNVNKAAVVYSTVMQSFTFAMRSIKQREPLLWKCSVSGATALWRVAMKGFGKGRHEKG